MIKEKIKEKIEEINKRITTIELCLLWCKWNCHEITSDEFVNAIENMIGKKKLLEIWMKYNKIKAYKSIELQSLKETQLKN